ncbi:MAG: NTP transferase domain-containing protein [Crenarchaeota archaeon]|nr:NTP transferase domain-containing protein [Thermoproteota archaeon]
MLAGGRSRRFGRDKLLALVDGRRVIDWVKLNLKPDVGLTTSEERCRLYGFSKCVYDRGEGPALAVSELGAGEWLVAPGDHPWLKRETLEALRAFRELFGADVAVPLHGGEPEATIMSVAEPGRFKPFSGRLTDFVRLAERAVLVGTALLTRDPMELAHVNTPESLRVREPKGELDYSLIVLDRPCERDSPELYRSLGLELLARHAKVPVPRAYRCRA